MKGFREYLQLSCKVRAVQPQKYWSFPTYTFIPINLFPFIHQLWITESAQAWSFKKHLVLVFPCPGKMPPSYPAKHTKVWKLYFFPYLNILGYFSCCEIAQKSNTTFHILQIFNIKEDVKWVSGFACRRKHNWNIPQHQSERFLSSGDNKPTKVVK